MNGGASWNIDSSSIALGQIKYIYFADPRHGWIVSDSKRGGFKNGMFVYRYVPDGLSVAAKLVSNASLTVFPNPASSSISLRFNLAQTPDKIEIVDAIGRTVYARSGTTGKRSACRYTIVPERVL